MTTKWEPYNYGPADLVFYDGNGHLFTGTQEELWKLYDFAIGTRNVETNDLLVINHLNEIIATGKALP